MLKITRQYFYDYCGELIKDSDDVHTLQRGRIGYDGENLIDRDPGIIRHYHDYCIEYLMLLKPDNHAKSDYDPEAEPELEEAPKSKQGRGRRPSIDIGKLRSLVAAGWEFDQIMLEDEFKNRDPSGIRRWIKKINDEAKEGQNR